MAGAGGGSGGAGQQSARDAAAAAVDVDLRDDFDANWLPGPVGSQEPPEATELDDAGVTTAGAPASPLQRAAEAGDASSETADTDAAAHPGVGSARAGDGIDEEAAAMAALGLPVTFATARRRQRSRSSSDASQDAAHAAKRSRGDASAAPSTWVAGDACEAWHPGAGGDVDAGGWYAATVVNPCVRRRRGCAGGAPKVRVLFAGYLNRETVAANHVRPPSDAARAALARARFCGVATDEAADGCAAEVPVKYWRQRYRLWHRFDEGAGIRMDPEGWYSVTPEAIASYVARRCAAMPGGCHTVVDAMTGCGGNAVAFAAAGVRVTAVDIDGGRLAMAAHNAGVYGVLGRIEFVLGDFAHASRRLRADAVFLAPPWGGVVYSCLPVYDVEALLYCSGGTARTKPSVLELARRVSSNVAFMVPRNVDVAQLRALALPGEAVRVERVLLNNKAKCVIAWFGGLAEIPQRPPQGDSEGAHDSDNGDDRDREA